VIAVNDAIVAFGANLGDPREMFSLVRASLERLPNVVSVKSSSLYSTAPVGGGDRRYYNGAFQVRTPSNRGEFFNSLANIERQFGRTNKGDWSPRTIDLDLILYSKQIHDDKQLTIPHPRMHYRRFVLDPIVEITPLARHPVLDLSCESLRARCQAMTGFESTALIAPKNQADFFRGFDIPPHCDIIELTSAETESLAVSRLDGKVISAWISVFSSLWERCPFQRCFFAWRNDIPTVPRAHTAMAVPAVDFSSNPAVEWTNFWASLAEPIKE
jgi:2-amino-4-hydroxy-6-hydroxymethyldihydropteridine diphosphokinase